MKNSSTETQPENSELKDSQELLCMSCNACSTSIAAKCPLSLTQGTANSFYARLCLPATSGSTTYDTFRTEAYYQSYSTIPGGCSLLCGTTPRKRCGFHISRHGTASGSSGIEKSCRNSNAVKNFKAIVSGQFHMCLKATKDLISLIQRV